MKYRASGLGKGLDLIFMQNNSESQDVPVTLKITELVPNSNQPRFNFNDESLKELANSIAKYGLIQPIIVRPSVDGTYKIIAGERRWRASKIAGIEEVPVIVKEVDDLEVMELALVENLQREDLGAIEEAKGYKALMRTYGFTQEDIAKNIGKSRSHIANTLRLLDLPDFVIEKLEFGEITPGHARTLLSLESKDKIKEVMEMIISKSLSVRQSESLVKKINQQKFDIKNSNESNSIDIFFSTLENDLKEKLNRKIKIFHNDEEKGFIKIEFSNKDDLSRLCDLFSKQGT